MGESAQQEQAGKTMGMLDNLYNQISGFNPNVGNRFAGYQSPFDYTRKRVNLDEIYNLGRQDIERSTAEAIADSSKGTVGRLNSQGITGGSVLDEAVKRGQKDIYKGKQNALQMLTSDKASKDIGLMNQENADRFAITSGAQKVDMENILNMFRKYGLLQGGLGARMSNQGFYSGSNTWDDIFGGLNTVANLVSAFKGK